MLNNIFLIEDHVEALKIWRKIGIKGVDLVHLDAHIDFGFQLAKPVKEIMDTARSLKELKSRLEYCLAFTHYEKDFNKQTNIGNYIYPAMEEGMVKDFYWVIPGRLKEFKKSLKVIKGMLKGLARQDPYYSIHTSDVTRHTSKDGIISTKLLGRKFVICILEKLPILKQKVLLDVDTDFLVIDSLLNVDNTKNVGKRKPWISPRDISDLLKEKVKTPEITTISYSVNGGYTPIKYKHFGDELAFRLAPLRFKPRFEIKQRAARYFALFDTTGEKKYYRRAIKLNSAYRCIDNNYGPMYLLKRRLSLAEKEFKRISRVDKSNAGALLGLGETALQRKDFKKARKYFSLIFHSQSHNGVFTKARNQSLFGLAQAESSLKNFKRAKELLVRYQAIEPLQAQSYYLLGRILEKEKDFLRSAKLYRDAIRLGFGGIEPISRLLKISYYFKEKDDIIKYIFVRYKAFKKGFLRIKRLSQKEGGKIKDLRRIKKKMIALEERLRSVS